MNLLKAYRVISWFLPLVAFALFSYENITYDSEPDYIASIFNLLDYGEPISFHHPGTFLQYFLAPSVYAYLKIELDFNVIVFLLRLQLLFASGFMIYKALDIMGIESSDKYIFYSLIWVVLIFYPTSNVLFKLISAETLLFPVAFLCVALYERYLKDSTKSNTIFSIGALIGIGLNIKLSFVYLVIVLLSVHFLKRYQEYKSKRSVIEISLIFFVAMSTFLVLGFQNVEQIMIPLKENFLNRFSELLGFWPLYLAPIFIVIVTKFPSKIFLSLNEKCRNIFKIILERNLIYIFVTIFIFYKFFFYYLIQDEFQYLYGNNSYHDLGILRRNNLPLFALSMYLMIDFFSKKTKFNKHYQFILLIVAIIFLNINESKRYIFNNNVTDFDKNLVYLHENMPDREILVVHDNYFDSKYLFRGWTQYRYGKCLGEGFTSKFDEILKPEINLTYYFLDDRSIVSCNKTSMENLCSSQKNYVLILDEKKIDSKLSVAQIISRNNLLHEKECNKSFKKILNDRDISVFEFK